MASEPERSRLVGNLKSACNELGTQSAMIETCLPWASNPVIWTSEAGELEPTNSLLLVVSVREGAIVIFY